MGGYTDRSWGGSSKQSLSEAELFEMLSNQRRRRILHALMRAERSLDIGTLSEQIAAWEGGMSLQEVTSTDRKRVYTALQQSHLPKMDRAGVIDFDSDRGTVEPASALEDVEIYMDVVHGREIPWSDYYLGLTGVAAALLSVSAAGIAPFTVLPSSAWGMFVVAAFGFSAIAHRYHAKRNRLGIREDPPCVEIETESRS